MEAASAWEGIAASEPGVQVWRVESFRPVLQKDPKELGKFFTGDSYVVLHKRAASAGSLVYSVHFWLGSKTTQDEAGAAAILATELDDALGGKAKQFRELQGSESEEFTQLFGELHYLQGGVSSGFHHVTAEKHVPVLLMVKGRQAVRVTEVPLAAGSLNSGDVFVADLGARLFVWAGASSNPDEKVKALEVVEARCADRNGQAEVVHVAEGEKSADAAEFFLALGVQDTSTVAIAPAAAAGTDAAAAAAPAAADARLYQVVDGAALEEVKQRPFISTLLESSGTFVLATGSAVHIWQGRGASARARGASLAAAHKLLPALGLPPSTPVLLVKQGFEDPAFTRHFAAWTPDARGSAAAGGGTASATPALEEAAGVGPAGAGGRRRSSTQGAVSGNGTAAGASANGSSPATPPVGTPGAKAAPAKAGTLPGKKPSPGVTASPAPPATPLPPGTPPLSAGAAPNAGATGSGSPADTLNPKPITGGHDVGASAPATPAIGRSAATADGPAKPTAGQGDDPTANPSPASNGGSGGVDAAAAGAKGVPKESSATRAQEAVAAAEPESGSRSAPADQAGAKAPPDADGAVGSGSGAIGAAGAAGSNAREAEHPTVSVRQLLDGFKVPPAEREAKPLPRLRSSSAVRPFSGSSSTSGGDPPFTPKPFVAEPTKPPRVAENLKYVPGKDVLPYEELKKLRAEDGVDMLCREAYLSDADFEQVFGKSRVDFAKLPKWRQQMAKKGAGLF